MNTDLKRKIAVVLSYSGTQYCGWQKQKDDTVLPSIQQTVEQAFSKVFDSPIKVVGSGRTDSGVHAVAQVIHFYLPHERLDASVFLKALNSTLPKDIRVHKVIDVGQDFHAQKSAVKKQYSYYFQQGACALPHLEPYSWWIRKSLDVKSMNQAAMQLMGSHDFKAFQARGSKIGSTVREIFEADVSVVPVGFPTIISDGYYGQSVQNGFCLVRLRLVGSGFLKQMVRGIAGSILEIAEQRRSISDFTLLLKTLDRQKVGATAPARALWLERVWYKEFATS